MNAPEREELEMGAENAERVSTPVIPLSVNANGKHKPTPEQVSPTQDETDAEALATAQKLFKKHHKTWTELAKY